MLVKRQRRTNRDRGERTRWFGRSGRVSVWKYQRRRGKTVFIVRQREPLADNWEDVSRHSSRATAFARAKKLERRLQKAR